MSKMTIRILEKDNNRRGDLFGRLMADLFVTLGYEQPRLNVHKSGRELDLSAQHRLEPRRAIAECKATADPIGGADINKFVGALDAEQKDDRPTTGYFISLSGFKETAIEQERQVGRTRVIMLAGSQVVDELVKGRSLIPKEHATELAGRYCAALDYLVLDSEVNLLAHERGWIWAIYYAQGKVRTHFALIHSDGTPLALAVADQVIAADADCGGSLHSLVCLNPAPSPHQNTDAEVAAALTAYRQYIENECGYVHLDGLPADAEVGSRRLRLENLFVPLHLDITDSVDTLGVVKGTWERLTVGAVLAEYPRLALLAAPGGGKSTLIKRLAVAYADAARRSQIDDDLPDCAWLPLFFRCRELRGLARGSFADLIEALSQREPVRQHAAVFRAHVDRALLAGHVLLLVDGMDEISDPGDRAAFVCTLRSALQAYPGIAIVVTSREAGFRHVAAHLASVCRQATLSLFDPGDVRRLTVAWHMEVVSDTEEVRAGAEQLAVTISQNDRIQRLAVNPLLLTTLLLVKRWVGALPTGRAALYGKAVEVLLMTWNTEGHEPIPEEEAMPQLCYVASSMMIDSVQKISRPRLAALLQEARDALPTELGYVRGTVDEFIHRIEDRSSLLMMTGLDVEEGLLVEFFEFRHLTFQEFLTARAMVEGWHPGRKDEDTLADVLEPHSDKVAWREVIPLAAVLGRKETEAVIQRLTEKVSEITDSRQINPNYPALYALCNCLADEAAARPETIRAAIRELVRLGHVFSNSYFTSLSAIARGRYGSDLRDESRKAFLAPDSDLWNSGPALVESVWWQLVETEDANEYTIAATQIVELLNDPETLAQCEGALLYMRLCFRLAQHHRQPVDVNTADILRRASSALLPMLFSEHILKQFASSWALAWFGACQLWKPPSEPDLLGQLYMLCRHSPDTEVRRMASWALVSQPIAPRDDGLRCASVSLAEFENQLQEYDRLDSEFEQSAVLIIAWYLCALSDAELVHRARALVKDVDPRTGLRALHELLEHLGEKPNRRRGSK